MPQIDLPLYTLEIAQHQFSVPDGSTFIYSKAAEEDRAVPSPNWFQGISETHVNQMTLSLEEGDVVALSQRGGDTKLSLHDHESIREALEAQPQPVYLDITGLGHGTWAPFIRAAEGSTSDLRVVYLEPREYMGWSFRDSQRIYDLSSKIEGLRPLPGFARLESPTEGETLFVPMLGFEGARFEYVLANTEANVDYTFPIVGVPGFRPDYAFYSLQGNRPSLEREFLHRRMQLAKANCPFEAFQLLQELHSSHTGAMLKIAPIGTKPHALGAVLYALSSPHATEIVYDNPVRARGRSEGQARVLVYGVSAFMRSPQFGAIA